jgi:phosphoglycerate dehydrogenase-like enzyme
VKVKVTTLAFSKNEFLVNELKKTFPDAVINEEGKRFNGDELITYLEDADAAIIGLEQITVEILEKLPKLKIIAKYGVGLDNIDLVACQQRNVIIGWTGGVNKKSVAEMTLGFMIGLSRNLFTTSNLLRELIWNKSGGKSLYNKTIGIIGFGNIGREVAAFLQPFQCKILVNDIVNFDELSGYSNIFQVDKVELYSKADIITIHTPLTDQTRNLITKEVFQQMKPTSFLINTARGGIVNEKDLKEALMNNLISGAALDVYEEEPPIDKEMLALPNLICTPHIGGNSYEAVVAMGESAISHLKNYKTRIFS